VKGPHVHKVSRLIYCLDLGKCWAVLGKGVQTIFFCRASLETLWTKVVLIPYALFRINRSLVQLLVTANVVSSSLILFTLMMEALRSSEMSVITRATQRIIPGGGIVHSHRC
jgi:hypothetical protein